jgi:signal transduction histidine kinase
LPNQPIKTAGAEAVLQLRLRHYQRLVEISRDLVSTLNLDTLLRRIIDVAVELSEAQAASILLYDESTAKLYFRNSTNLDDRQVSGISVPLEGSIAGWIVTHRQPVIVNDAHNDPRFFSKVEKTTNFLTSSMIGVPLLHKNGVLGVLEVLNKTNGAFTDEDLDILMVLAAQAAIAIQNTRLFQQSDLVSELVHELRTPLSSLAAAAYLLEQPKIAADQRTQLAGTIKKESSRLNELTSTYLELARLESGRAVFERIRFDLVPVIEECLQLIESKAAENNITLSKELAPGLPRLNADPGKIRQVLVNLLSNAVKYNQRDGKVVVKAYTTPEDFIIAVQDTGIGITQAARAHLFEKFYRSPEGEKAASGTGLGLSICLHIIKNHGGFIDVFSRPGQGSTFKVHLPLR